MGVLVAKPTWGWCPGGGVAYYRGPRVQHLEVEREELSGPLVLALELPTGLRGRAVGGFGNHRGSGVPPHSGPPLFPPQQRKTTENVEKQYNG